MDWSNASDIERGLQILFGHISSATFHDSHQRSNDTNLTVVKKWVQKWAPRLTSSDFSSISAFQAQPNNPEQIIVDVFTWLFDPSPPSPIMWIHHKDRSQTTFFAHTIANILDKLGKLSGSFFSLEGSIDITRIIPTLAFQLARNVPNTRSPIAQTVLYDLSVFDLRAESQTKKLIVDPLSFALNSGNMETTGLPSVFLIHGFEEFDNANQSQLSLLDAFSDALTLLATKNVRYRLLLVGRHSSYIKRCISNLDIGPKVHEHPIATDVLLELGEGQEDSQMNRDGRKRDVPWHHMNTLNGHTGCVYAITFSPDGTRLASGSGDKTARLWDGKSGSLVAVLQGHTNLVCALAFSIDGTRLASGSYDNMVRLWESKTGTLISTLQGHSGVVYCLAFSPDGSRLASGSHDKTVRLWEFGTTGSLVATLDGHGGIIYDIAYSADGSILASGSADNTVRLWDGKKGNLIAILNGHSQLVYTLTFSSYGSTLATGSYDKTVRLWEGKTGRLVATLEGHTAQVQDVAFSPDGSIIASGSLHPDNTVRLWDVKTGSLIFTLQGHSSAIYSVAFSADGSIVASGSSDNTVRLWDVETRSLITTLEGHSSYIQSVVFSPDGLRVASASRDSTVRLWH